MTKSGTIILFLLFSFFGCYGLSTKYYLVGVGLIAIGLFFIVRALWKGELKLFG